ncbi:MAG: hypothetical protein DHS20C17_30910 [Cyclobacteriaceae bacterium]|nr:MAG: hypothetical protein DHS20C17_30910 [Cyclobacteriaceae bacterium]
MHKILFLIPAILGCCLSQTWAQDKQYPVIDTFGGIYDVSEATVRPDSKLKYKVVIDLYSGPESPDQMNPALNNVARMINLHAIGGATQKMDVVLAIHGNANDAVLSNEHYLARHQVPNPNINLIKSLKAAGVKLAVCGQSLLHSNVDAVEVLEEVEIATSMLTTVTTYQLKGYAFLAF